MYSPTPGRPVELRMTFMLSFRRWEVNLHMAGTHCDPPINSFEYLNLTIFKNVGLPSSTLEPDVSCRPHGGVSSTKRMITFIIMASSQAKSHSQDRLIGRTSASLGPLSRNSASSRTTPGDDSEVLSGSNSAGHRPWSLLECCCAVHQLHFPEYISGYVYPEPYRCIELSSSI